MSVKKTWNLISAGVNTVLTHNYRNNVASGVRYCVSARFVVDGGPQHGREVEIRMSPGEAIAYADRLRERAERTAEKNSRAGFSADL